MKKKLLSALLCVSMVAALTGCGETKTQPAAADTKTEEKKEEKKEEAASTDEKIVLNIYTQYAEHFANNELSVAQIAQALCVNQTFLRKTFKSRMNMTLSEYLTQFRMQEARRLLTNTDHKLALIAEEVGYNDVSYFSNVFKKYYGVAPRAMSKGE